MIAQFPELSARVLTIALLLALVLPGMAGETNVMTVDARLIWGTNDKFSPNTNHTAVSPECAARLKRCLKWENYFLVTTKQAKIPLGTIQALKMSDRCTIEIKNVGGAQPGQIRLIGDGKQWGNTNLLADGNELVLAGDAENNTAWILLLHSGPKDGQAPKPPKKSEGEGKPGAPKAKDKPDGRANSPQAGREKQLAPVP